MKKGVLFKSSKGNNYFYDNTTGHTFYLGEKKEEEILKDYDCINLEKSLDITLLASGDDVRDYLLSSANGFKQVILEVTSACNFRCKYCTYSDNYEFTREHGYKPMDFPIAKKVIDYYFENFQKVYDRNPSRSPIVSFYGGEPFLNFELIKKIVSYIGTAYPQFKDILQYHTTTNGFLLNDKIQDFLYANNFHVLISLDGYKENHDRNRVTADGSPTFDKVYENYLRFKKRYPDQSVFISACYDLKTDMKKFSEFTDEKNINILRTNIISDSEKYYGQFSQEDREKFLSKFNEIRVEFFKKMTKNKLEKGTFLYNFFGDIYGTFAYHRMAGETLPKIRPCTATCVPGEKIYVESNGDFIVCEKVNNKKKIGNVYTGLDYNKIAEMLNEYNMVMLKFCEKCNVSKLCPLCFKDFCRNEGFEYNDKICDLQEKSVKSLLVDFADLLEENPKLFEEITTDYYVRLNTIGEMI